MNTVIKCCHNCKEREVDCHSRCNLYLDQKSRNGEV